MPYPGGNIIRITPACDTATDTAGDIIFDTLEIPNAVSSRGGVSLLRGITVINYNDTPTADFDVIFMQVQTNLGTEGGAIDVADSVIASAKMLGHVTWDSSDNDVNLINGVMTQAPSGGASGNDENSLSMMLKAVEGSRSVYFTAIDLTGSIAFAADGLEFIFHIEYLG